MSTKNAKSADHLEVSATPVAVVRGEVVKLTKDQLHLSRYGRLGSFPAPDIYDSPADDDVTLAGATSPKIRSLVR